MRSICGIASRPAEVRRGFTVIELLVATAITAVMAALLISITTGVMSVWNRSRGSLTTANQVKLALDQLATDIEGAITLNDGNVWLAATILETNNPSATTTSVQLRDERSWVVSGAGSARIKPESDPGSIYYDARNLRLDAPTIEDCSFGRAGVWLRFFTVRAGSNSDASSLSAPIAVAYQLCRRRVGSGSDDEIAYMLYRSATRPAVSSTGRLGTFEGGYNLDPWIASGYTTSSGTNGASDGDLFNVVRPIATQVLANNVIDFGVRFYVREGTYLRLIFPAQASTLNGVPLAGTPSTTASTAAGVDELSHLVTSFPAAYDANDAYRHVLPDVVEVMIRVLTEEGVARIQAIESGASPGDWWDTALAHSRVYTRRVEIKGRPL